ncbi:hypothetical protein [Prosthecomicrobium pneumaticum]|uniref:Uncharacterized protein n=1 Tax=Prosthecomicrobium pneumaticum TaxID=81895 RepID=A0A7W9CUE0_9HYPH|nr:hypothetical protein [Prosthecomicrobium pneumaticum]MBB5752077.1 hypothetical protein [Prosthecomicrobium pneumaticum]
MRRGCAAVLFAGLIAIPASSSGQTAPDGTAPACQPMPECLIIGLNPVLPSGPLGPGMNPQGLEPDRDRALQDFRPGADLYSLDPNVLRRFDPDTFRLPETRPLAPSR